ncbi:MAG: outer membrane beta-barrel protein [Bacteroidales bacterium]|nr:outer membrane beta-barrel protein [Bacteroidales bacterium]
MANFAQQNTESVLSIGTKHGVNFSQITFEPPVDQSYKLGYTGGLVIKYQSDKHAGVQAEFNFSQRGWSESLDSGKAYSRTLNYFEIPVLSHFVFGRKNSKIIINLGPNLSFYTSQKEEMKALQNILDWCESNEAIVFLQIQGNGNEWNSYPEVHPYLSAPYSVKDFANGVGFLLDYLFNTKKYTCIKYFCIANEPTGGTFAYWYSKGPEDVSILPTLKAVSEEIKKRGIPVKISGPDWTDLPPMNDSILNEYDPYIQAYDIHSYQGVGETGQKTLKAWADYAHSKGKPFFLSEFGNMTLGWGADNPGPKSFNAAISNATDVIRGLRVGVDGFSRWSFTNRGDIDGQWQLIQTWDRENKRYLDSVQIEKEAFYGYAMITRFIEKKSQVLHCVQDSLSETLFTAALRSPKDDVTVLLVNTDTLEIKVNLNFTRELQIPVSKFILTKDKLDAENFIFQSENNKDMNFILPPRSISVITSSSK